MKDMFYNLIVAVSINAITIQFFILFQWSQHPAHFMAAGNGDTNYMPLKCEYPDEGDDDDLPDENDFIAPLDYIDPVSKVATLYVVSRVCQ